LIYKLIMFEGEYLEVRPPIVNEKGK